MLILKGILFHLIHFVIIAGFLLAPAGLVTGGTWHWPRALALLGVVGGILIASNILFALKAPESLKARLMAPVAKQQPVADRFITVLMWLYTFAWYAFIPLDVFHWKLLPPPPFALSAAGGVLYLTGWAIALAAVYQNSFAAPIVTDQSARGQAVVDTGLYAQVRHPLYLGLVFTWLGAALWLESYAALIVALGLVGIIGARIVVEEQTLRQTLPGYVEYMQKVPHRLIPFVL